MPNIRALVVDDSLAQRMMVSHFLTSSDIEVVAEAEDGEVGLARYTELMPDLVVLDLVMPKLSGREVLEKIMASNPEAKVIIASSLGGEADLEACLRLGAKAYVQKPYDFDDLLATINALF